MKKLLFLILIVSLFSCKKTQNEDLGPNSVYHLNSDWQKQDGSKIKLADLKGKVVVMVMIYTSCKTACPQLTAEMRKISRQMGDVSLKDIQYVLVSIDPKTDTPERMKEYLDTNKFTGEEWVFLRSDEENTRELSNVLAVKYKEISPMEFSHSNIISVFSRNGELVFQKEGLNIDVAGTVAEIKKQLN